MSKESRSHHKANTQSRSEQNSVKKKFSEYDREEIRRKQGHKCAICEKHLEKGGLEIHHIVPLSHGGLGNRENGLGVCRKPCHEVLDEFALNKRIYFPEVIMEPGFWYSINEMNRTQTVMHRRQRKVNKYNNRNYSYA